jgi:glycosyltransferase involved in cell wall biosynthesis
MPDSTTSPHRAPLVSVIIPCFVRTRHDVRLLEETLSSVCGQTCNDHEVIVVDDGSPEPLAAVVAGYPRTSLLRRQNGGSAQARNTGIAASRGEFIVFLDADDHLLPAALDTGIRNLEEHPWCGWTVGAHEEMTYEGAPVAWTVAPPPPGSDIYLPLLAFDWYIIPPSSAMFRRSLVEQLEGFRDPWGADDLDFYLRAARARPAWCSQSPAVTRYRRYSASSSRDGERMLASVRTVYERRWPLVRGNRDAEAAYHTGLQRLTKIFRDCVSENLRDRIHNRHWRRALRSATVLMREKLMVVSCWLLVVGLVRV